MDAWNTRPFPFGSRNAYFQVLYVPASFRDCKLIQFQVIQAATSTNILWVRVASRFHSPSPKNENQQKCQVQVFMIIYVYIIQTYCLWKQILAPVEVGSLSHYLRGGVVHPTGGCLDFWTINSIIEINQQTSPGSEHFANAEKNRFSATLTLLGRLGQQLGVNFAAGVPTVPSVFFGGVQVCRMCTPFGEHPWSLTAGSPEKKHIGNFCWTPTPKFMHYYVGEISQNYQPQSGIN